MIEREVDMELALRFSFQAKWLVHKTNTSCIIR